MRATWAGLFDNFVLCFGGFYLLISMADAWDNRRTSAFAVSVLLVNGIAALVGLRIAIAKSYLLFSVFFVFNFMFLSVAPLQQIGANFDPIFNDLDLLNTACALCAFMTMAGLIVMSYRTFKPGVRHDGFWNRSLASGSTPNYPLLALVTVIIAMGLVGYLGSSLLKMNREVYYANFDQESSKTANILVNSFFRPFALIAPVIGLSVALARRNAAWALCFMALVAVGILINNPLVSARFRASALIVFCVLTAFGPMRVRLFLVTYFAGLLVSPILGSVFRYVNSSIESRPFSKFFANVDFSGLDIFCYAIMWTSLKGYEYGSNIVGALFFFVPRSIWPTKGKTVGETIREYIFTLKGFGTDNVSAPPPVEGYFSFGVIGAMLMSIAIVLVIDRIERLGRQAETWSPLYFILCLSPMLCLILLRGPFQVGVSEWAFHSAGIVLSAVAICFARQPSFPAADADEAPPISPGGTAS